MSRLEALEQVAEAAAILAHSCGVIRGKTPEDDDIYTVELDHIRELNVALAALDALPPPQPPGETVEVRAVVWGHRRFNQYTIMKADHDTSPNAFDPEWQKAATITARVPLPTIPTITATVEPQE
jgi:hypothetical protein